MENYYKNELLSCGRNIFRGLHNAFGFDFEKPIRIIKQQGKFTVGSVNKMLSSIGFKDDAVKAILLTDRSPYSVRALFAVEIFSDNSIRISCKPYLSASIVNFEHKCDFDYMRKSDKVTAYIIAQAKEYIPNASSVSRAIGREPYYWQLESDMRYKPVATDRRGHITAIADESGKRYSFSTSSWNWYFDKSGYCVRKRRDSLGNKATNLRAARKYAKVQTTDYSEMLINVETALARRKAELINMLLSANTAREIADVGKAIGDSTFHGFADVVDDVEQFRNSAAHKSFTSVEAGNALYDRIMKALAPKS